MPPRAANAPSDTYSIKLIPKAMLDLCTKAKLDTDAKVARAFHVAQSTVSRVTTGETDPSPMFIATACKALGCTFDDLFKFYVKDAA